MEKEPVLPSLFFIIMTLVLCAMLLYTDGKLKSAKQELKNAVAVSETWKAAAEYQYNEAQKSNK